MGNREAIARSLALLTPAERRRLWRLVALQTVMPFLDLLGVVLIGLVVAIAAAGAGSQPLSGPVADVVSWLGFTDLSNAALTMGVAAALILVAKSVLSLLIVRRINGFMVSCTARVSAAESERFLSQPLAVVRNQPSQRTAFALTRGLSAAVLSLLGSAVTVWGEIALLTVLGVGLLVIDPVVTLAAFGYLVVVAVVMHRLVAGWTSRASHLFAEAEIGGLTTVQDAIGSYREIRVTDRADFFLSRFETGRRLAAKALADQVLARSIPRYGMEAALVVGAVLLVSVITLTSDTQTAVTTLAVFLAAATRIMPSLLRLNAGRLDIAGSAALATSAYDLIETMSDPTDRDRITTQPAGTVLSLTDPFSGTIEVSDIWFRYPDAAEPSLKGITLSVSAGSSLALVGPTGAGKSTLTDLILGVLEPDRGRVLISGRAPGAAIRRDPGAIGYVPQDVAMIEGSVRDNVAFALESDLVDDDLIIETLRQVDLADVLLSQRDGLDTRIGEAGVRLSAGQRQRLGLARALYSGPRLLVLDEATSALDSQTEQVITAALATLADSVTIVTVAHRLSTVRHADQVGYLSDGQLMALGSFDEVRRSVPQFDRQAHLLGL